MYIVTMILTLIGGIFLFFACWFFLCLISHLFTRSVDYIFSDVICLSISICAAVILLAPYTLCKTKGDIEMITEQYNIYQVDGDYIVYTGKQSNRVNVYVKTDAGAYKLKFLEGALFKDLDEDKQPYCEIVRFVSSWWIFETQSEECYIYLSDDNVVKER